MLLFYYSFFYDKRGLTLRLNPTMESWMLESVESVQCQKQGNKKIRFIFTRKQEKKFFFKGSSRLTALPNKHGHHATLSKETKSS